MSLVRQLDPSAEFTERVALPAELETELAEVTRQRQAYELLRREMCDKRRHFCAKLLDMRLSAADIARLIGVTPQRIASGLAPTAHTEPATGDTLSDFAAE